MKTGKHKKRRNSGLAGSLIFILSLSVFLYSGYRLISILLVYRAAASEYGSLQNDFTSAYEIAAVTATPEPAPSAGEEDKAETEDDQAVMDVKVTPTPAEVNAPWLREDGTVVYPAAEAAEPPLSVNWEELKAVNSEIVGWLYVDALPAVSYPVLQTADNDYYLHHTFRREYLFAGSIFMDYNNSGDFSDPNTIVYGHNMRNGSMFGSLKTLMDPEVWQEEPYFWILTPEADYRYRIYSVMETPAGSEVYTLFGPDSGKEFLNWEKRMQADSSVENDDVLFDFDLTVTLSTCTNDESTRRVVMGRRVYALEH